MAIAVKTTGKLPFEHLVLVCGLRMGSQVVAEGEEMNVFLPTVLDDVNMMRVGDAFSKGVTKWLVRRIVFFRRMRAVATGRNAVVEKKPGE